MLKLKFTEIVDNSIFIVGLAIGFVVIFVMPSKVFCLLKWVTSRVFRLLDGIGAV